MNTELYSTLVNYRCFYWCYINKVELRYRVLGTTGTLKDLVPWPFNFLVPTWYRSTGSFDNTTHLYGISRETKLILQWDNTPESSENVCVCVSYRCTRFCWDWDWSPDRRRSGNCPLCSRSGRSRRCPVWPCIRSDLCTNTCMRSLSAVESISIPTHFQYFSRPLGGFSDHI